MTIEQLLNLPPEGLEAIPDAALEEMLAPYFRFTRPDSPIGPQVNGSVMTPGSSRASMGGPKPLSKKAQMDLMMEKAMSRVVLSPEKKALLDSLRKK